MIPPPLILTKQNHASLQGGGVQVTCFEMTLNSIVDPHCVTDAYEMHPDRKRKKKKTRLNDDSKIIL